MFIKHHALRSYTSVYIPMGLMVVPMGCYSLMVIETCPYCMHNPGYVIYLFDCKITKTSLTSSP